MNKLDGLNVLALVNRLSIENEINLDQAEVAVSNGLAVVLVTAMVNLKDPPERVHEGFLTAIAVARMLSRTAEVSLVKLSGMNPAKFRSVMGQVTDELNREVQRLEEMK